MVRVLLTAVEQKSQLLASVAANATMRHNKKLWKESTLFHVN